MPENIYIKEKIDISNNSIYTGLAKQGLGSYYRVASHGRIKQTNMETKGF